MNSFLFKTIAAQLATKMPEVKQIEIYSGQYYNPDAEANPIFPPAMFVEFGEMQWENLGQLVQQAIVPVRIHAVAQHIPPFAMDKKPTAIAAYSQAVGSITRKLHQALHGFNPVDAASGFTAGLLTRISTSTLSDAPPTLHVTVTTFHVLITDASATPQYNPPAEEPEITITTQIMQ